MSDDRLACYFGRPLTNTEQAIADACGESLSSLAAICIQEAVSPRAAARIVGLVHAIVENQAKVAAQYAAEILAMERAAPGSISSPTKKGSMS